MAPLNWNQFIGGMPWMQQGAQVPNTFTGKDANGVFQGGGDQTPGAGAQLPQPGTYGTPQTQTGSPSGNPFLTNSAMQGIGAATQPFNSQYYDQVGQSLYNKANRNLFENVIPQIQQSGQAAGQYGGGSRNQIAQGIAMRGMNEGVFNAMAPLYAQGYESNLNRNLQGGQTALQGLLGLGNLDIQRMNAETNAASAMANAAGAPQYSNPYASGLGAMMSLLPFLSGTWGK